MRIVTYGKWKGSMCFDGSQVENPDGNKNCTYNSAKEEGEVEIVLRLRPGETNMIIDITDKRGQTTDNGLNSGMDNRAYRIYKILAENL